MTGKRRSGGGRHRGSKTFAASMLPRYGWDVDARRRLTAPRRGMETPEQKENATDSAKTHEQMRAELIEKAAGDQHFRARLIDQPKAAIKEALELDLPEA